MKTISIKSVFVLAFTVFFFGACKKDNQFGTLELHLEHTWNGGSFALNQPYVHPTNNDTATFTLLRYYISNIQLENHDGEIWSQPESYHLIDMAGSTDISIEDVPADEYTEISYTIGVDSTRNVSGAQTGALSTANDMFWSWNSGYIFLKAEGTSPNSPDGTFTYHIGGFSGSDNAIRTTTTSLGSEHLQLKNKDSHELHFLVDVAKLWDADLDISTTNTVHMPGANAAAVATNLQGAFSLDHIH